MNNTCKHTLEPLSRRQGILPTKEKRKNMSEQEQGITVFNECYDCMVLERQGSELKCLNCTDELEANQTFIAHQIVDEGNLQYKVQMTDARPEPSAHEWVSSKTVISSKVDDQTGENIDIVERYEFAQPIVQLQDGGIYEELWELDDETQARREVCCNWCHLMTPKIMLPTCQCCDKKVLITA